jgi:hypothetical protein
MIKVVKDTASSVSKIKNVAESLIDQMKGIPLELKAIADAAKGLKDSIEDGDIIEKGKKCREAKLENILLCYEHAFGKIETVGEPKEGGGQGCCTTF